MLQVRTYVRGSVLACALPGWRLPAPAPLFLPPLPSQHATARPPAPQCGKNYDLASLTMAWRDCGLWITRAKASPGFANTGGAPYNTFYVSGCCCGGGVV